MKRVAPPLTLRERNRAATRAVIADAALQLAMRDGLGEVRTEDIAAAAGVSPRTFSNYFVNKFEALTFRHVERMRFAAEALRMRPADEPIWQAITNAILAPWLEAGQGLDTPSSATLAELRLLFGDVGLRAEILKGAVDESSDFARVVAGRVGMDAERDLYPRLVAASATIVTQVAMDAFLRADPPVPQLPLLVDALAQLAAGLPDPKAHTARAGSATNDDTRNINDKNVA